jgi:hypothetical protein
MFGILLTIVAVIILAPAILVAIVVYSIRAARRAGGRSRRIGNVIEGEIVDEADKPR